jgi:hypothetical protein
VNNSDSFDNEVLKDISKKLAAQISNDAEFPSSEMIAAIQYCLVRIRDLEDENESLWLMLDELKESELKNYSGQFQTMIDRKLAEIRLLMNIKPGEA